MPDAIAVEAYAGDCLVRGELALGSARLSDYVAERPNLSFRDVRLLALADGHERYLPHLEVSRDEIVAFRGPSRPADPRLRLRRVPSSVAVLAGPYRILGNVHVPPGTDPISFVWRRGPSVPFTDARIRYVLGGSIVEELVPVLVVNRNLVESMIDAEQRPWDAIDVFPSQPEIPTTI